jgi:hypothetical protein
VCAGRGGRGAQRLRRCRARARPRAGRCRGSRAATRA